MRMGVGMGVGACVGMGAGTGVGTGVAAVPACIEAEHVGRGSIEDADAAGRSADPSGSVHEEAMPWRW